jgi:hypothetical protein
MGRPCPHDHPNLCEVIDRLCLELFPYEEHIQAELVGGTNVLRMLRLALLECHRNGPEAMALLIDGMTNFYWPR